MIRRVADRRRRPSRTPFVLATVLASIIALVAPASAAFTRAAAAAATTPAGGYVSIPWARIADTTTGVGVPRKPAAANGTLTFTVSGKGGVPASGVGSVVLNVTAKSSKAAGALTVYPSGAAEPTGANLTFAKGAMVSNLVTVALGTAGQVKITNGSTGTTQITADVVGYFAAGSPTAAGAFATVPSARVLDTTTGVGTVAAAVAPNGSVSFTVAGAAGVPASGAGSVVLNVTAKSSTAAGTLTVYPSGASRPAGANLTYTRGATVSNLVTVALGSAGNVTVTNGSTGTTQVTADVLGYFLGGPPTLASTFATVPASRVLDTTTGVGAPVAPIPAKGTVTTEVAGNGGIPASGVAAVVLNVTAKNATASGALKVYTAGTWKPAGAYLTFAPGAIVSELAIVAPSSSGAISVASTSSGKVDVTADVLGYVLSTSATPPPPSPAVTGLSPTSGPAAGGTAVTITGTDFTGATAVTFGSTTATFSVTNSTTIAATAPAGTGTVDVTVTTGGGTSTTNAADKYTYVTPPPPPPSPAVTGLSPTSGPAAGGTAVTITGTDFTGATAVTFGSTTATFSVTNATTIAATAPAGTGTVDVTVTTGGGTSTTNAADKYTYTTSPPPPPPAPTVTGLSPTSGPAAGGTAVTITGTNFTGATTVEFGAASVSFTVTNDTTILATAPAGTGTVDVAVTTGGGTSTANAADKYTYVDEPAPGERSRLPWPGAGS